MKLKTTEKIIKFSKRYFSALFYFLNVVLNVVITLFIVIGSCCSMILLYKLYPEIGLKIFSLFYPVFYFLYYFIKTFIYIILGVLFSLGFFYLVKFFTISDIKREKRKEKFMNEIIRRVNKRSNK